jgi:hypothetical protein
MSIRTRSAVLALVCLLGSVPPALAQQDAPTAEPDHIVLQMTDGSFIVGIIKSEDADKIIIDAGTLGTLTIPVAQVANRIESAQFSAAMTALQQQAPPAGGSVADFAATARPVWTRTITFGGSYTSAPYKQDELLEGFPQLTGRALGLIGHQTQAQAAVNISRATREGVVFFEGSQIYAFTEPVGKVAGTLAMSGGYNHALRGDGRVYILTKYTFRHDKIREIDYSHIGMAGVGYTVAMRPHVKFDLVPGLAIINEKKGTEFDERMLLGVGFIEELMYQPHPVLTFEQREMFYMAAEDSEFWGLESYLGVRGMLTKALGLQFGFTHTHDNTLEHRPTVIPANRLFPGQPQLNLLANRSSQSYLTAGVMVRW